MVRTPGQLRVRNLENINVVFGSPPTPQSQSLEAYVCDRLCEV